MRKRISFFGKSTILKSSNEYKMLKKLAYSLVKNNCTCIHGGYAGGVMEAVSLGAHDAAVELSLDESICNLGIPEKRLDRQWVRVPYAHFKKPSCDIYSRLRMITDSDVYIVAPSGGHGTFLEVDLVIHENIINSSFGGKTKPIIFIEKEDMKWTYLFLDRLRYLDISQRNLSDYPFLVFLSFDEKSSIDVFIGDILKKIHNNIM